MECDGNSLNLVVDGELDGFLWFSQLDENLILEMISTICLNLAILGHLIIGGLSG